MAHSAVRKHLRLVTFNTRRFTADDGTSSVAAIASHLASLKPDVLCLNEVDLHKRPTALADVQRALSGAYGRNFSVQFFGHVDDFYGNAILSAYSTSNVRRVRLDGGSVVKHKHRTHRIHRGLLVCEVHLPEYMGAKLLRVATTHLDHMSSAERTIQTRHVLDSILLPSAPSLLSLPTVLLGDLNALRKRDYTLQHWAHLQARNRARGWAAPADDDAPPLGCLHLLAQRGLSDLYRQRHTREPMNENDFTAHVDDPSYRIDSVHADVVCRRMFTVRNAWVDRGALVGSDHFPLVVDLDWRTCDIQDSNNSSADRDITCKL